MDAEKSGVLTPQEVADELKVVPETVLRLLRTGELAGFKVGASWRIRRAGLDAYIEAHSNALAV